MSVPAFGMSERDFRAALRKTKRAIIPVGSLEQHGMHFCGNVVDTQLVRNCAAGGFPIAGDHCHAISQSMKGSDGVARSRSLTSVPTKAV